MSRAQPFTKQDLERGEGIVRRLHGVTGFDNWAQLIAQELAAERERATQGKQKEFIVTSRDGDGREINPNGMSAAGFQFGAAGASGKAALLEFMMAIATAPDGSKFEVGLIWDADNKWRVYQRIGDKALMLSGPGARKLYRSYEKMRRRPEWANITDATIEAVMELDALGKECIHKNRNGEVPSGATGMLGPEGNA